MCDRNDRVSGILQKISRLLAAAVLVRGVASGRPEPPLNLADQLTLFKPGGQIMPLTLLPPLDSKSYLHL